MADTPSKSAALYLPKRRTLAAAREAVQHCAGCPLYKHATRAVFGEGLARSTLMLVGEQPGDQEDRQGKPFVGPAGQMLHRALREAGIPREVVFVTNAVKHFKFEQHGKRRLHKKPSAREVKACQPWLFREIEVVKPRMLVAMGATAARSLFGAAFRVSRQRGQLVRTPLAPWAMATVHPSSLLRAPNQAARRQAWEDFVADWRIVRDKLEETG